MTLKFIDPEVESRLKFGVVFIDKPKGPTSHQVTAWVRNILNVKKTGHAGTLDPKVTGVLPIALNKATKIINFLHLDAKEYISLLKFHKPVSEKKIRKVMAEFQGPIFQTPPVRAAVSRTLRKRIIYKLEILEINGKEVLFRVLSESGTYIRTLCVDIGEALGVGAHMEELRRVRAGQFDESRVCKLQDLLDAYYYYTQGNPEPIKDLIYPGKVVVETLPKIIIKDSAVDAIAHGASLYSAGIFEIIKNFHKGQHVSIFTQSDTLVAVGLAMVNTENLSIQEKKEVVRLEEVLIEPGIYPRGWKKIVK